MSFNLQSETFFLELCCCFYSAALSFSLNDYGSLVTKLRKARGVILVTSTPQIRGLVTKFSKMAEFSSSDLLPNTVNTSLVNQSACVCLNRDDVNKS